MSGYLYFLSVYGLTIMFLQYYHIVRNKEMQVSGHINIYKGGIAMMNYPIKLNSVKDVIELKKLADRYGIRGEISQNGFHGNMRSVIKNIMYLPLDDASIEIDGYRESQIGYIKEAISRISA